MIANGITISRILFSLILLAFPTNSFHFAALYLLCGGTDILDGFAARRLHTESDKGALLDSAADLLFALVYSMKILPLLSVPPAIRIWAAFIAAVKITGIVITSIKARRLSIAHSFGNKLTGLALFVLPLSLCLIETTFAVSVVCVAASLTAIKEIIDICSEREYMNDPGKP